MTKQMYEPKPIDTSNLLLQPSHLAFRERLAENAHDVWARKRIEGGWIFGSARNDERKTHPCLVPCAALPEMEKDVDRSMLEETLKAIIALGIQIQ